MGFLDVQVLIPQSKERTMREQMLVLNVISRLRAFIITLDYSDDEGLMSLRSVNCSEIQSNNDSVLAP